MNDNLFFDRSKLRRCGHNVIIGLTARIRYPELVSLGDNVIIDDFTYISTALEMGAYTHISSGCKLIGGRSAGIVFGSFSTLAPNVVLSAGSDDYTSGLATPMVPPRYKAGAVTGTISLGRHCIVGANSTVLPDVRFGDGACLGAQSLAKCNLAAWSLYVGVPARKIKDRAREEILRLEAEFVQEQQRG